MQTAENTAPATADDAEVMAFFDGPTFTLSYVVRDPSSRRCAIIDPVMDFDPASAAVSYGGADQIIAYVTRNDLEVDWILETHVHADHLSGAAYLKERLGGQVAICRAVTTVQETFGKVFNEGDAFSRDGSQFDRLLDDGDTLPVGELTVHCLHTPGHTPACMTFVIGDAAFVGDTLFMPDSGTARCDFPGGDARTLYHSIHRILSLPATTRLFMCHDYAPGGRGLEYETTVAEERRSNVHVNDAVGEGEYVALREARDATLDVPRLILPSLQVNMRAGHLPDEEASGQVFLKLPINAFA